MSDGLAITQFSYSILVLTEGELQIFHNYLEENGLLYEEDEWRIGPIIDDDKKLIGIIMQIKYGYAFKAKS